MFPDFYISDSKPPVRRLHGVTRIPASGCRDRWPKVDKQGYAHAEAYVEMNVKYHFQENQ